MASDSNKLELSCISDGRSPSPVPEYDSIYDNEPAPPIPATTRPVNCTHTMISKETAHSPEGEAHQDLVIRGSSEQKKASKKIWHGIIATGLLVLFISGGVSLGFTLVKTLQLESQILKIESELKQQVDINTNSLNELLVQHQYLVDTLENLGQPSSPAASCASLLAFSPTTPSGYYWVRASNGSAVRVYCDMTRSCGGVTGGWTRVVSLNYSNDSTPCPSGLQEQTDFGIRTCAAQSPHATCASVLFSTSGVAYSTVCGKVLAYPLGSTGAFSIFRQIDSNYVDGVSLTHGSNPRKHIWTFAAALDESSAGEAVCECSNQEHVGGQPPAFVGQDYFCDSGVTMWGATSSPLWDGSGCGPNSTCCSFNNPPWFYKQLPSPTSDGIEMRVCRDEGRDNEDITLSFTELLVR
jgi:hypothetical protein